MKENKEIKNLTAAIEKVAKTKRKVGDEVQFGKGTYRIVEITEDSRLHIKNVKEPYNSVVVAESDLVVDEKNPPDLMYRPDDNVLL